MSSNRPFPPRRAEAIAAGGAAGAAVRWVVINAAPATTGFPWAVFGVNLAGSLVLGVAMAEEWTHPRARVALHDLVGIGFCGGLTTFSTLALETAQFLDAGRVALAIGYALASAGGAVAAAAAGAIALRRFRALTLPLEEEP